ncbi:MAG: tetratricopeptide repeat protein, partial [Terriglobia bacterium]
YGLGVTYLSLQDSAVVQLRKLNLNSVYARALLAEAFLQQGRTHDVIKIYNQLLDSPTQPPCLLAALGFAYAQAGSLLQARKAFRDELKRSPGCLPARLGLASVAITKGDSAGALRELRTAWNADQNFLRSNVEQTWSGLSPGQLHKLDAWLQQNSPPSSQDDFTKFLVASIESRGVNRTAALVASERRADQGSAQHREFEKPSDPAQASPEVLWAGGHYTACKALLQRVNAPLSNAHYLVLAPCSYYAGDYRTSLLASQAALRSDPRSLPGLYWKAKSAQQLAKDALVQTSILAPGSSRVHLLLAELYREREQSRAAEAEYAKVIDSQSTASAAHLGLANVYYQELQFEPALAQLRTVLQEEPANPEASFLMGQILVKRHQYAEAIPALKAALRGSPLLVPQVHSLLARCYADQGQYAQALAELKPALPTDTEGIFHYQLFQLYRKMGDQNAAAAALLESERLRKEEVEQTRKLIDGAGSNH